jgi:hypothetical protein
MPDRHEASSKASSADSFVGAVVLLLLLLLGLVLARAGGLGWTGILHWSGELLLITGIGLAAVGISDVRHEWTKLPGIRGRTAQAMRAIRARVASWAWDRWNRFAEKNWLARRLGLPLHIREVTGSGGVTTKKMKMSATGTTGWGVGPQANATLEERVAWLEKRMQTAGTDIGTLFAWHEQEVSDRQAATREEQAAREAEDQRIRERMADLAGGGLRLQTWGVVCLLAGTVITAIW